MTDGHHTPDPTHGPGHEAMPEGEEQAPPGTRTMALVRWALVGLMALAAAGAWVNHLLEARSVSQAAGVQYLCPMHPQIVTGQKGECPICGMDLVPAGEDAGAGVAGATAGYTCAMHPAFVSADPKTRCPECGMRLVPRQAPQGAAAGQPAPAAPGGPPVPGVVPVELSADRVQLVGIRSVAATRETLASAVRSVGFVAANEGGLVSVNTRYSGWVEQLAVAQTGQLVRQGDILAAVYSPEMLNAQQVFLNAIKWSERKPGGSAPAPAIASDLERDARLRLELLGVAAEDIDAIAKAGQPLRALNVRSPVRGYVARKNVLRGLYVQSGTELFQLADLSTVWVLVDVYESEIPRVKVGQQATFELKAYPGKQFTGRVQFIYPALNTGSRTLQARVELRNPSLELRPGMFGDVTLDVGVAEAVVIPREALIDTGDHQYVFVERGGGRYEPRPVQAGWSGGGKVAILAGLAEGERVVTTANFLVDSESRLRAAVEGFNAAPGQAPAAAHEHDHGAAGQGGMPMSGGAAVPAPAGAEPRARPRPPAAAGRYTCPMHPALDVADAKARCPICGMRVVPRPPGGGAPAMKMPMDPAMKMPMDPAMKMPMDGAMPMPAGGGMKMPAGDAMPMPAEGGMKMPAGDAMPMPAEGGMKMPAGDAMPMPAEGGMKMPAGDAMPMPAEGGMKMPDGGGAAPPAPPPPGRPGT
ncbi:MAG: efflux RND transporter periplasmic adaptor subunit [Anaeromyxobacter sp.]|nr:efflux RND transporter periplasmic adaptor subunit [Anaeromyxobacter sp.]